MSEVIYKYSIEPGQQIILLPRDAKVLSVQTQYEKPQMWVLLDPDAPKVGRLFGTYSTGVPLDLDKDERLIPLGTFQLRGGTLVFHTFEIVKEVSQ